MMPEAKARQTIDALLVAAGWYVCNVADAMQVRIVAEIGESVLSFQRHGIHRHMTTTT